MPGAVFASPGVVPELQEPEGAGRTGKGGGSLGGRQGNLVIYSFVVGDDWAGSGLGMTGRGGEEFSSPEESAGLTWWDLVSTLGGASFGRTHVSLDPPSVRCFKWPVAPGVQLMKSRWMLKTLRIVRTTQPTSSGNRW